MGEMYPDCAIPCRNVGKPGAIPFLEDDFDIATLVDDLPWDAAEAPRRFSGTHGRQAPVKRDSTRDRKKDQDPKIELVLYTSAESEKSRRAVRAIRDVLKRYDASQVRLSMCDLSERPAEGEADSVVFTPTLVKQGPGPRTAIIGNLERADILCDLLDASGVDRRWDD